MNKDNFVYWVNGMLEYADIDGMSPEQMKRLLKGIRSHLDMVMDRKADKIETAKKDAKTIQDIMDEVKKTEPIKWPSYPSPGQPGGPMWPGVPYYQPYWLNPDYQTGTGDFPPKHRTTLIC